MAQTCRLLYQEVQGRDPISHANLAHLSRVSVALCISDDGTITDCFKSALQDGISEVELREVILTSYLFDGYPTALEGFRLLADVVGTSSRPHKTHRYSPENIDSWQRRGEKLCNQIYGPQYEPLMARVADIAPQLRQSMIVEGYGKVLARSELNTMLRELCVVSILIAKKRPRQLMSHALGAIRLGADKSHFDTVIQTLSDAFPGLEHEPAKNIINTALIKLSSQNGT